MIAGYLPVIDMLEASKMVKVQGFRQNVDKILEPIIEKITCEYCFSHLSLIKVVLSIASSFEVD